MARCNRKSDFRALFEVFSTPNARVFFCLILIFVFSTIGNTQEILHWRTWKDPDTLLGGNTGWIHIGANGRIWLGQSNKEGIIAKCFDGYQTESISVQNIPMTIREGRAGQIWGLNIDLSLDKPCKGIGLGRYAYDQDINTEKWTYYSLGEHSPLNSPIIPFSRVTPLNSPIIPFSRVIPLNLPIIPFSRVINVIPSNGDSLLILLEDRLMEIDPVSGNSTVLKKSKETNRGGFIHMRISQDGALWITAERGLAKVIGIGLNKNQIHTSLEWIEWPFPHDLGLRNLAIPIEAYQGEVFGTAASKKDGERHLVCFKDSSWEVIPTGGEQKVVMGWRGFDDSIWVIKADSIVDPLVPLGYLGGDIINWFSPILWQIQDGVERMVKRDFGSSSYLWHIDVEPNGAFWLGQERSVTRYAPATWRVPPGLGELEKTVFAAHEDCKNRLWFLTSDSLLCFDRGKWRQIPVPTTDPFHGRISRQSIGSFRDGRVVFVTNNNHLFITDGVEGQERVLEVTHPSGHTILTVETRKEGGVWVASTIESTSRTIIEVFNEKHFEEVLSEKENLPLSTIDFQLLEDSNGDLWMVGTKEIGRYRNGEFQNYEISNGAQSSPFTSLIEMGDGMIWIGGNGIIADIIEFNKGNCRNVAEGIGWIRNMMRQRDGTVWIASTSGVYRYVEGTWINNRQEDGIFPDIYTFLEDQQGQIWVGTSRGILIYHPDADPDPPHSMIREEDNLRITPPGGEVRIVYSGVDRWNYTEPERLLYSPRIDDGPWSSFSKETITTYSKLSPGDHTFAVRAVDRNWNVEPNPATFRFTVLAPWHQNSIFLILIFLGSGTILFLAGMHLYNYFHLEYLVKARTSSLVEANQELITHRTQLQNMTAELSIIEERERRQLATDLHDSISQSLSLSIMELATLPNLETMEKVREKAITLTEKLDQILEVTQNLTFELCPPELYQIGLEAAIQEITRQLQRQYSIKFHFEDDHQYKPLSDELRYFLFRAARELLMNITKHANAKQAKVSIRRDDVNIYIQVRDNGIGFQSGKRYGDTINHGGFGLFNIRERLRQIGGSLKIESQIEQGSEITIVAPLKNDSMKTQEDGS